MKRNPIFLALSMAALISGCIVTRFVDYAVNPDLSPNFGIMPVSGIDGEARIYRDKWGVAHVAADSDGDMFFAVGYAQALDRLFEMDMYRRYIVGRLSEILGDMDMGANPKTGITTAAQQDRMHRIIGFKFMADSGAELMRIYNPETYKIFQRYSDGVNAAIRQMVATKTLPMEYRMLAIQPEEWKPADSVAIGRFVGWSLAGNLDDELIRYALIAKFGEKKAWELLPNFTKPFPTAPAVISRDVFDYRTLKPVQPQATTQSSSLPKIDAEFLASLLETTSSIRANFTNGAASNNWVIGGKKSASGKPILANDPHLAHLLPSVFWVVHQSSPGIECYGVTFPGLPFVVLGHNKHLAWGMTTSNADVQDVFVETPNPTNPNQYKYKDQWVDFAIRKETIRIRKGINGPVGPPIEFEVKLSKHGPIINYLAGAAADKAPPLALRWVGYDITTDTAINEAVMQATTVPQVVEVAKKMNMPKMLSEADAMLMLIQGKSLDDYKRAMSIYAIPNQNWVFADDSGNFGYMAAGRIPLRPNHNGTLPVDGSSGKYDWTGFIPPEHLPQVFNPERGYVASANNEVVPAEDYPYTFSYAYDPGYRAVRIHEMLEAKEKLTAQDMAAIQNDVLLVKAREMLPILIKDVENMPEMTQETALALAILKKWDYRATIDSVPCTIFNEWTRILVHKMLEDDLGDFFKAYTNNYFAFAVIDGMIFADSPFMDDIRTPEKETRKNLAAAALIEAVAGLKKKFGPDMNKWTWGRVHTISFNNPLGIGPLAKYLNYGPLPHSGSEGTVRNASFPGIGDDGYAAVVGPCLRHIVDMADIGSSLFVIDGGESGQWKSPHYTDGAQMWHEGKYMTAIMDMNEVAKMGAGLLILKPMPKK